MAPPAKPASTNQLSSVQLPLKHKPFHGHSNQYPAQDAYAIRQHIPPFKPDLKSQMLRQLNRKSEDQREDQQKQTIPQRRRDVHQQESRNEEHQAMPQEMKPSVRMELLLVWNREKRQEHNQRDPDTRQNTYS
jgi:hypothetical protein